VSKYRSFILQKQIRVIHFSKKNTIHPYLWREGEREKKKEREGEREKKKEREREKKKERECVFL